MPGLLIEHFRCEFRGGFASATSAALLLAASGLGCESEPQDAGGDVMGGAATKGATATGGTHSRAGAGGSEQVGTSDVRDGAIAASQLGTCALDAEGGIHCWGLGDELWQIPGGSFSALSAGGLHVMCGVREDGSYSCFREPVPGREFDPLDYLVDRPAQQVAVGSGVVCLVGTSGASECGQGYSFRDLSVPSDRSFSSLSAGIQFVCGILLDSQKVYCWGYQGDPPDEECWNSPRAGQLSPPDVTFQEIASAKFTTCGIDSSGNLACWGAGAAGADPDARCVKLRYNFGQADPPGGTFKTLAIGDNHACAVASDGSVACWGAGESDDCDIENWQCRQSRPPSGKFEQVTVGLNHSCAMTKDRKVECWGYPGADGGDGRLEPPEVFR